MKNRYPFLFSFFILSVLLTGCSFNPPIVNQQSGTLYLSSGQGDNRISRYTPFFLIHDSQFSHNLVGKVSARFNSSGKEEIFIDTRHPTLYYGVDTFATNRDRYTNYIYRIHFPEVPFSLFPFHLTSGSNPGLIIVVTVGSDNKPVLVTTVHTCGCYLAILPTSHLSKDAFPKEWKNQPLEVYGERLQPLLKFGKLIEPALIVTVRPGIHRIMAVNMVEKNSLLSPAFHRRQFDMALLSDLEKLPLGNTTTSFFYKGGILDGHVKDSIKPWETLLMSLISLDFFVGSDKKYDYSFQTQNSFYTSLKPWNRTDSDMRDFKRFLTFWGWSL